MCREWKRRLAGLLVVVIMATSIDPFALYGWRDAYGAIFEIDESVGDASSSDADEIELWDDLATSGDAEIEEILLEEDNEALMAPGIPVMAAHGTKSIEFTWKLSVDNDRVAGYDIYRDGEFIASVSRETWRYKDQGLEEGTSYQYEIYAFDYSGNISDASETAELSTAVLRIVSFTKFNGKYSKETHDDLGIGIDVYLDKTDKLYDLFEVEAEFQFKKSGEAEWSKQFLWNSGGYRFAAWSLKDVEPGNYQVRVWLKDADGTVLTTEPQEITITQDIEAPTVKIISPIAGEIWGGGRAQTVRVSASDNHMIKKVVVYYSLDGGVTYMEMGITQPDGGAYFHYKGEVSFEAASTLESGVVLLKAVVYDGRDNKGESEVVSVQLDNDPPANPADLKIDGKMEGISLSWSYPEQPQGSDFDSFKVYRSTKEDGDFICIKDNLTVNRFIDTVQTGAAENTLYYYYVTAMDRWGNESGGTSIERGVLGNAEEPVAVIRPAGLDFAEIGQQIPFSGADSVDVYGISSYEWDFGDGSFASGEEVSHTYRTAGVYTVTLTVTNFTNRIASKKETVNVIDWNEGNTKYTKLTLHMCDAITLEGIDDAAVTIIGDDYETGYESGQEGKLTCIIPNGRYRVRVAADGYMSRTITIEAKGGIAEYQIGLSSGNMVTGEFTVTEMTYDEMIAAGIDPNAEGNQHVFKFETVFRFTAGVKTYDVPFVFYKNENGKIVREHDGRDNFIQIGEIGEPGSFKLGLFPITENFVLAVYGEAHWLKEMFKVDLLVINNSNTDTLEQVEATLVIPEGISLADMQAGSQSLTQQLGSIGNSESTRASWYIRGDKEGEFNLTARIHAVSMPYGETIEQTYTTSEPVKVYAGNALHMTITADDMAERGKDYTVKYRLENVSDQPVYNLVFGIGGSEQYKVIGFGDKSGILPITNTDYGDAFTRTVKELEPGGYVELELRTTIWFNSVLELIDLGKLGAFVDIAYYLHDISVITLDGSTSEIPYSIEINRTEREHIIDKVIDEVVKEIFGDILPDGTIGGTLIEIFGDDVAIPDKMIKGSKKILSVAQGETDHKVHITIDDGRSAADSIYNDFVIITTGTPEQGVIDVLSSKLTMKAGELSITAKAPGSTKVKIGVENKYGELEREYVLDITVEDHEVKSKITMAPDSVKGKFSVDAKEVEACVEAKREDEIAVVKKNPYLWFDSTLEFELNSDTQDTGYEMAMQRSLLDLILNKTKTTDLVLANQTAELVFDRKTLEAIAKQTDTEFTIASRRLSEREARKLGSTSPTYEFKVRSGSGSVSDFGDGGVYISVPYELGKGARADHIFVEHIRDDGTVERIHAEYNEATRKVGFFGNGFSYYRIVSSDTKPSEGGAPDDSSDNASDSSSEGSSNGGSVSAGTVTVDEKKGIVNSSTGVVTGIGEDYSEWQQSERGWKLRYADGTFASGSQTVGLDGTVLENYFWELVNGAWYAFGADGYVKDGWLYDPLYRGWFYIDIHTGMKTGWQLIDGKWYYFNQLPGMVKGILLTDTRVDGYYVDKTGAWVS